MRTPLTAFSILVLLALPAAAQEAVTLKKAPGLDTLEQNCAACHSLDYVVMNSPFLDRKGWTATVTKMINVMGAPIDKPDADRILDYLSTNYAKD